MYMDCSKPDAYKSCIKIFGIPILPPLITDERRKEINEDKLKAIEIEKKLKGKRSSIDSGVMTGSYMDHLKNNEPQQISDSQLIQCYSDDLTCEHYVPLPSCEVGNYVVSDSYLKSALEDPEFRDFFSTTAEKIFKDNKIENILDFAIENDSDTSQLKNLFSKGSETQSLDVSPQLDFQKDSEFVDISFSDNLSVVPSVGSNCNLNIVASVESNSNVSTIPSDVDSNLTIKASKDTISGEDSCELAEDSSSLLPHRIRRNSYTLESPSPALLEHLAKELKNGEEASRWHTLPDKKDKTKGPGFKTFSIRGPRKHWNKNICNKSSILGAENNRSKYTLRKSNTFVKPSINIGESNYSLPVSSPTSPLQNRSFTRSVDCFKSLEVNSSYAVGNKEKGDFNFSPKSINSMDVCNFGKNMTGNATCDSKTFVADNGNELQSLSLDTSPTSLINNPSCSARSYSAENCSPPQIEFSDSASQISGVTQSTYIQQNSGYAPSMAGYAHQPTYSDFDELTSLCSSLSISRFLPMNDNSRPSTADDQSEKSIRLLKMKHENELRELLEKQKKEEEMYSQLMSTTMNLSDCNQFETNFELLGEGKKDSCIRELFPSQTTCNGMNTNNFLNCSEKEKVAATKLTACVKGYLTRRLLKTEKVQQLIELIKESLTCAFSLQKEPHLKPNDLDLHARLAHQLNAALCELQDIVSSPAAVKMSIIAADRERLRRPASRPSSTISAATRKSILRRQMSLNSSEKNPQDRSPRLRTKSSSDNGNLGTPVAGPRVRSGSVSSAAGSSSSRLPWR